MFFMIIWTKKHFLDVWAHFGDFLIFGQKSIFLESEIEGFGAIYIVLDPNRVWLYRATNEPP